MKYHYDMTNYTNLTKCYTQIDNNNKEWYTYSFYSSDNIYSTHVDQIFKKRNNWKKVQDQNATFIYLDGKGLTKTHKNLYLHKSCIKHAIKVTDDQIINKSTLYHLFMEYD